jgi:type VI secretion system secreted protein Hcp
VPSEDAVPIYLNLDEIQGDATQVQHRNWIAVDAMTFAVARNFATRAGVAANREGTQPALSQLHLSKRTDRSSPHLLSEACAGAKSRTAKLHFAATGSGGQTYLEITLNNVLLSGYRIDTHGERPMEVVRLDFTAIQMRYVPAGADNQPQAAIIASYDRATARAS